MACWQMAARRDSMINKRLPEKAYALINRNVVPTELEDEDLSN